MTVGTATLGAPVGNPKRVGASLGLSVSLCKWPCGVRPLGRLRGGESVAVVDGQDVQRVLPVADFAGQFSRFLRRAIATR